jgi:hypothetical protein
MRILQVCSLNPEWVMILSAMEGFSLDISKLVDFLSHSQDASEVLHAERIIFQLTSTAQGRTQLARHLHEDKAVMLLRALDEKTHGADEISELANQVSFMFIVNKHQHAGQLNSFTYLRALLVVWYSMTAAFLSQASVAGQEGWPTSGVR